MNWHTFLTYVLQVVIIFVLLFLGSAAFMAIRESMRKK